MLSRAMSTYLIKKSLISQPVGIPRHIKQFFIQFKKINPNDIATAASGTSLAIEEAPPEDAESDCPADLPENIGYVLCNYIILKKIFSSFNTWQELKLLSTVSKTWADILHNMSAQDLSPRFFYQHTKNTPFAFKCNAGFNIEPSLVLVFATKTGMKSKLACKVFPNTPCEAGCEDTHLVLDYIYARACYPKNVMVAHECLKIAYSPPAVDLPEGVKNEKLNYQLRFPFNFERDAGLSGVFLPKIPGVQIFSLKLSAKYETIESQVLFAAKVLHMLDYKVVKCLLMFSRDFDNLEMLDILMKVIENQGEDTPMAIGGCAIERSAIQEFNHSQSHRYVDTIFTFFAVDKEADVDFGAYSKVFDHDCTVESDLVMEMKKMSDAIPRREHSAALKLSCIGRDPNTNTLEDRLFRQHFPTTSLVGCYGQGELGSECLPLLPGQKRKHIETYTHAYSTVFVIYMWGKLL